MSSNDQHRVFGAILGAVVSVASILMAAYIFLFLEFYSLLELPLKAKPYCLFVWGIAIMLTIAGVVAIQSTRKVCENTSLFGFTLILFYILIGVVSFAPIALLFWMLIS